MDRMEFLAKAEEISSAGSALADRIRELAKQAQGHDWSAEGLSADELCGDVADLPQFADDIEEAVSCVEVTFKVQSEM